MTEPRNDENLEGIQGLARGLDRLLPRGGARGEAIRKLDANQDYWQARAEAAERELEEARALNLALVGPLNAKLAAVREARPAIEHALARDIPLRTRAALEAVLDAILDGEGEK